MTNFKNKDKNRRNKVFKYELKRIEYKSIIHDLSIPKKLRYSYVQKLNNLPKNSSNIRVRNRCILTGRGRSVFRFCKLSRIVIRQLAAQGLLTGLKKASW
jgi:small subunit ribosomal protein S14